MNKNQEGVQQKQETEQQFKTENRLGVERRMFSYSFYIPERRSGKDRRTQLDITIHIE
jgi:hypothetical protein